MTLSLMIYNIAQRRMRNELEKQQETIPNQIGKAIKNPTLRWVFQIFEGINFVKTEVGNKLEYFIIGVNSLHKKIIRLFGETTCSISNFSNIGCSMSVKISEVFIIYKYHRTR